MKNFKEGKEVLNGMSNGYQPAKRLIGKPPHIMIKTACPVMLNAIEKMSDEQLNEEQRVLTAEIEAAHERLSRVETEIFYRKNPECRRY